MFRGNPQATGVAAGGLPEKLERLWTFSTTKGGFESTAAIVNGVVYIGSTDGNLYALDLATGHERWRFLTQLGFTASAAVCDGRVYIGDSDGTFYCVDAPRGESSGIIGRRRDQLERRLPRRPRAVRLARHGPLLSGRRFRQLVWKYQNPDQIRCFPSLADDRAFVAGCDGRLHIIDLKNGAAVGGVKIKCPHRFLARRDEGDGIVTTEGHTFFAIDLRDDKIIWRKKSPKASAAFRSSAAVSPRP